jgi:hypothetical protein
MAEKKKKITFKVALFGTLGLAGIGYAFLRRPRYLYDGRVQACEGSKPLMGIDQKCTEIALTRGNGSGKIFAPFNGTVHMAAQTGKTQTIVIRQDGTPLMFHFTLDHGAPALQGGQTFKVGDVIGQAERVKVSALRNEGGMNMMPMSPSAWLIANSFLPASQVGDKWCEDSHQVIVPSCPGVTFRAPELPKWSLRTVRMTM